MLNWKAARLMSLESRPEIGSFRDRHGQVFYRDGEVLRGVSSEALSNWEHLASKGFYKKFSGAGKIIPTELIEPSRKTSPGNGRVS